jgi:hypothetical protein
VPDIVGAVADGGDEGVMGYQGSTIISSVCVTQAFARSAATRSGDNRVQLSRRIPPRRSDGTISPSRGGGKVVSDELKTVVSEGLPRRSFLVSLGSVFLGVFRMPAAPGGEGAVATRAEAPPVDPETGRIAGRIRRLVGRPVKGRKGHSLAWTERWEEDGELHVMRWTPETPEEVAEAERFYRIARWRSWNTTDDLKKLLTDPGPWLIRYNLGEVFNWVNTVNEAEIYDDPDALFLTNDPAAAARMSAATVMKMMPRLMSAFGNNPEEGWIYFEPVKPEWAAENLRDRLLKE